MELSDIFAPRARTYIIEVLLEAPEPLRARDLCARAEIDRSTFHHHERPLLEAGILDRPGKEENANLYCLNEGHPVVDAIADLATVADWAETGSWDYGTKWQAQESG